MANKLPWFTHDHDAHDDRWIRHLVREQGHVAGWLWWVLVELHHKHGVGDLLKISMTDVAQAGLTSTSVVNRVLTEMGTEFEGQLKVRWKSVRGQLQLEIPKLRERLAKLKSKIPRMLQQRSPNVRIEVQEERDIPPISPKGDSPLGFAAFWSAFPNKTGKIAALRSWKRAKPDKVLTERIVNAVLAQRGSDRWKRGFIPNPATWLNQGRWEDEVVGTASPPKPSRCPSCRASGGDFAPVVLSRDGKTKICATCRREEDVRAEEP